VRLRGSIRQLLLICVLVVHGLYSALAQSGEQAPNDSTATFRISADLVIVNVVTFRGATSTPDITLTRDDFELFDNDRRVPIRTFDKGSTARPLAVWFLVQCPMPGAGDRGSEVFRGRIDSFRSVLKSGNGSDTFGVAHWCDDGTSELDLLPAKDPDLTLEKLEQVLNSPVTANLQDRAGELALQGSLQKIVHTTQSQAPERIPAVIFLYDDYSAMPKNEADQFVDQLLSSSITVYGLRDSRSPKIGILGWLGGEKGAIATYIATQTGGSYFSREAAQYAGGLKQILDELHTRYELGFAPQSLDGQRHRLRVALSDEARKKYPSTRLTYRSGYRALPSSAR
jgi:hypothetical protein